MRHTKGITTQDFNKICRFCAKPCNELKPIFKSEDFNDPASLTENVSVPYLFQNTLNLDVGYLQHNCVYITGTLFVYDIFR